MFASHLTLFLFDDGVLLSYASGRGLNANLLDAGLPPASPCWWQLSQPAFNAESDQKSGQKFLGMHI